MRSQLNRVPHDLCYFAAAILATTWPQRWEKLGAVVCTPSFGLGRVAILMLGSRILRYVAIVPLAIAPVLQIGATSSVKAIEMSTKLTVGKNHEVASTFASGSVHSTQ